MKKHGILGLKLGGLCIAMAAGLSYGQVGVETDPGYNKIFQARNSGSTSADGIALYGENKPVANWGIGVQGEGGYMGVRGFAEMSGAGGRFGGYFRASGGSSTNYGIYSSASGASNYAGFFSGNVMVTGVFSNPSDERLKRNVAALERPLAKVMALRPATYEFDGGPHKVKGLPTGRQVGLMAGDLESVLPELVQENPVDAEGSNKDAQ